MLKYLAIAIVLGLCLAALIAAAAIVAAPEPAAFADLSLDEQIDWTIEHAEVK